VSGSFDVTIGASLPLARFNAAGWGPTPVWDRFQTIAQDQYLDQVFTVGDAAYIDVATFNQTSDIDLFLSRQDPVSGDWDVVGSSGTASGNEEVRVSRPAPGTYKATVSGFSVTGGSDSFRLRIAHPETGGTGVLAVSSDTTGTLAAGASARAHATWSVDRGDLDARDAVWEGVAGFGPGAANQLLSVPVDISYPFTVTGSAPGPGRTISRRTPPAVFLSRRADPSTITSATVFLTRAGSVATIPASVSYDDDAARVAVTPVTKLAGDASYTMHVTDAVTAVDGTPIAPKTWSFNVASHVVTRISGADRYATAVAASRSAFTTSSAVVLAGGSGAADALSASGLCGAMNAPLLLTPTTSLRDDVLAEIDRLGATSVFIVGGQSAVSGNVYESLVSDYGADHVVRLSGADRYETAASVAAAVRGIEGTPTAALVTRGDGFADALSASAIASSRGVPVLFVKGASVPLATQLALGALPPDEAIIFGGEGAISSGVEATVRGLTSHHTATRWAGTDRYATAAAVAAGAVGRGWLTWSYVGLATGTEYADGLAGGVAVGRSGGPLTATPASTPPRAPARSTPSATPCARRTARGHRRHRRVRRPVLGAALKDMADPVLVSGTDGVGTKLQARAAARQARHRRHRPGGDVRQRHPRLRRRAALLPRLRRRRQARLGAHGRDRRGHRRGLPPGRLRAGRRRDGRAPRRWSPTTTTCPASASASSTAPR
jgi:putative cell wall-binding protein